MWCFTTLTHSREPVPEHILCKRTTDFARAALILVQGSARDAHITPPFSTFMLISPLGTGSSGNSHFIESDGTSILVDAGFGIRTTAKRLERIGRSLEDLDAIVLTHEHSDHIKGAASIAKKCGIPVYATRGTLDGTVLDESEIRVVEIRNNTRFRIGELEVHAAKTSHDAFDPSCYVVESVDGTRVGIATDLGFVEPRVVRHLQGCDALFFEANHDVDLLRRGTYPWVLKRRILSRVGHLSNDDSMAALRRILCDRVQMLTLIHLSKENNHESIVREMAMEMLDRLGATIDVRISRQGEPAPLQEISRTPLPAAEAPRHYRQLNLF